jgi:hypothetical protein
MKSQSTPFSVEEWLFIFNRNQESMYMPVFRTEKVSDYAVIAKHHLKNRALSYKAKGLMTFMLSLPEA